VIELDEESATLGLSYFNINNMQKTGRCSNRFGRESERSRTPAATVPARFGVAAQAQ
jgi:hypothetical protein